MTRAAAAAAFVASLLLPTMAAAQWPAQPYPPQPQPTYPPQPQPTYAPQGPSAQGTHPGGWPNLQIPGLPPFGQVQAAPPPMPTAQPADGFMRGLEWFYADAEVGPSYVGASAFGKSSFIRSDSSAGVLFGAELGLRLLIFTIGPRFRYHALADFGFWQLGGAVGVHVPLGHLDFGGDLFVGYSAFATIPSDNYLPGATGPRDLSVQGGHFGLHPTFDYYFTPWLSLGATAGVDFLFLGRSATTSNTTTLATPAVGGSAQGLALNAVARLGFHF